MGLNNILITTTGACILAVFPGSFGRDGSSNEVQSSDKIALSQTGF